jgi:LacI family transcriptional regulator
MGTLATQMLLKRILSEDDEYPAETKVLNADLIVRGSSII